MDGSGTPRITITRFTLFSCKCILFHLWHYTARSRHVWRLMLECFRRSAQRHLLFPRDGRLQFRKSLFPVLAFRSRFIMAFVMFILKHSVGRFNRLSCPSTVLAKTLACHFQLEYCMRYSKDAKTSCSPFVDVGVPTSAARRAMSNREWESRHPGSRHSPEPAYARQRTGRPPSWTIAIEFSAYVAAALSLTGDTVGLNKVSRPISARSSSVIPSLGSRPATANRTSCRIRPCAC
jgi:hypothetical protein